MIQQFTKPFKYFFKLEAASGLVLLFAAILALIISNGQLSDIYFSSLEKYIILGTKEFGLKLSVLHWICLLYTSPSPRDLAVSRMPSSA